MSRYIDLVIFALVWGLVIPDFIASIVDRLSVNYWYTSITSHYFTTTYQITQIRTPSAISKHKFPHKLQKQRCADAAEIKPVWAWEWGLVVQDAEEWAVVVDGDSVAGAAPLDAILTMAI